jgi:hypothetical protein
MAADDAAFLREYQKRTLREHLALGREKAVSYLPIETIEMAIGVSLQTYVALIENAGNRCALLAPENCCIRSGAVYAYRVDALEELLNEHSAILSRHGWPLNSDSFVTRLAADWLDESDPVLPVVRRVFGER